MSASWDFYPVFVPSQLAMFSGFVPFLFFNCFRTLILAGAYASPCVMSLAKGCFMNGHIVLCSRPH